MARRRLPADPAAAATAASAPTSPTAMRVFEALARADASVGWTVMIGAGTWIDLAGLPAADVRRALRRRARRHRRRGVQPDRHDRRRRRRLPGDAAGGASPAAASTPAGSSATASRASSTACRSCASPCSRPTRSSIEDTWNVSGLCGTGSHHFRVDDVVVPAERTLRAARRRAVHRRADRAHPAAVAARCVVASVALGIAAGRARRHRRARRGQGAAARPGAARHQPAVPARPGHRRHRAARRAVARCTRPPARCGRRRVAGDEPTLDQRARVRAAGGVGDASGPRASSTPPTAPAAAARCTPTARCSAASATSTPSPSTSSSGRTRSPPPAPSSPATTST